MRLWSWGRFWWLQKCPDGWCLWASRGRCLFRSSSVSVGPYFFLQYCLTKAKILTYSQTTKLYSLKMITIRTDPVIPWTGLPAGMELYRSCCIVLSVIRSLWLQRYELFSKQQHFSTKIFVLKKVGKRFEDVTINSYLCRRYEKERKKRDHEQEPSVPDEIGIIYLSVVYRCLRTKGRRSQKRCFCWERRAASAYSDQFFISPCSKCQAGNNMARQIRKNGGTGIYHVMLRGINRQDIFEDDVITRTDPMIPFMLF